MNAFPPEDPRRGWPTLPLSSDGVEVSIRSGRWCIRCAVRKKWLALEPEEWVRQHLVQALIDRGWSRERMRMEHPVRFGGVDGRVDVACFDRRGQVELALEVKAPSVSLDQKVADQLARYDLALGCPWLMMSNGLRTAVWHRTEGEGLTPSHAWPQPE